LGDESDVRRGRDGEANREVKIVGSLDEELREDEGMGGTDFSMTDLGGIGGGKEGFSTGGAEPPPGPVRIYREPSTGTSTRKVCPSRLVGDIGSEMGDSIKGMAVT